ncbi:hypothetical protein NXS19_010899 [Fusarium pseudograminearum]|uniref:Uncharacterized protein n=1 Tax=Fusarium pseudograminearum (strain CS3096) TaxID=1028729 RepID=K3UWA9_FUSPC|nr:hypothetical protein FPSE_02816 [Fusarium pseudograminearum CS3096]EKJ76941.1 hypothetical protein FPSE_02816 [Fusarium pseudograminearum CS3096]UZP43083.1 hypothetical protein NXS19_010899 [Fusarium pseudograminearum]
MYALYKELDSLQLTKNQIYHRVGMILQHRFGRYPSGYCYAAAQYWMMRPDINNNELSYVQIERTIRQQFLRFPIPHRIPGVYARMQYFPEVFRVLDDAEAVMEAYSTEAWRNTRAFQELGYLRPRDESQAIVLTMEEKTRFLDSVLQYEYYCHMFFYRDEILFNLNSLLRLESLRNDNGHYFNADDYIRFYSIVEFISAFYRDIFFTLKHYISSNPSTNEDHLVRHFRTAGNAEDTRFLQILLCQGTRLFVKVHAMDSDERTQLLLE